jgi:hypothetical protein
MGIFFKVRSVAFIEDLGVEVSSDLSLTEHQKLVQFYEEADEAYDQVRYFQFI